jgi:hypothetical protein
MTKEEKDERDRAVCRLYLEGQTQAEISRQFLITEAWVSHILKKAGLTSDDRPKGVRTSFIGIHVSPEMKEALRQIAEPSMSRWVADLIAQELKDRGISTETAIENEIKLPFGETSNE